MIECFVDSPIGLGTPNPPLPVEASQQQADHRAALRLAYRHLGTFKVSWGVNDQSRHVPLQGKFRGDHCEQQCPRGDSLQVHGIRGTHLDSAAVG